MAEKAFLSVIRADFAEIQNEVLIKNGDTFLVRLFNRIPEEYIGIISSKDDEDPKIEQLKKFHSLRHLKLKSYLRR